jgi:hypothetical protein
MTGNENVTPKINDGQPPATAPRKKGPWIQIAIVFVSAVVLGASSCATMAANWQKNDTIFTISTVVFMASLSAIPCTIVWAIIALILKLVRKRGAQV